MESRRLMPPSFTHKRLLLRTRGAVGEALYCSYICPDTTCKTRVQVGEHCRFSAEASRTCAHCGYASPDDFLGKKVLETWRETPKRKYSSLSINGTVDKRNHTINGTKNSLPNRETAKFNQKSTLVPLSISGTGYTVSKRN